MPRSLSRGASTPIGALRLPIGIRRHRCSRELAPPVAAGRRGLEGHGAWHAASTGTLSGAAATLVASAGTGVRDSRRFKHRALGGT
jgi:hypothetical protein